MPGYSGKVLNVTSDEYKEECERLNELIHEQYKRYYEERKAQGIVEKFNEDGLNVGTLTIDDFLPLNLSTELMYSIIEFYLKYRPTYISTILSNGKIPKDVVEIMLTKKPETIKLFHKNSVENYNVKEFVLAHVDSFIFGDLPEALSSDPDIKAAFDKKEQVYRFDGRDSDGYDENWLNENGELKEWFKFSTGYKPKSKEEYMEIFYKFIAADVTVPAFCAKYRISSNEGFTKFLDRVAVENKENEKIVKEQLKKSSDRFWLTIVELSKALADGSISFMDVIMNNTSKHVTMAYIDTCTKSLAGVNYKDVMYKYAEELYKYIMDNRYTLRIDKLAMFFEADYINNKNLAESSELTEKIKNFLHTYGYNYNHERPLREYFQAKDVLSAYRKKYDPETDKVFINMVVDGKTIDVTDEHREQLVLFLEANHLPFSMNLAYYYLKEIVSGRLDYTKEALDYKAEKEEDKKRIQEGVESCNGPQDYFRLMDAILEEKDKKKSK